MNNYAVRQASGTWAGSTVRQASLIGLIVFAQLTYLDIQKNTDHDIDSSQYQRVRVQENLNTYGQYTNIFTGEYRHSSLSFEEAVVSFYTQLAAMQEPLGEI